MRRWRSPKRTPAGVRRGVRHNSVRLADGRWAWRYNLFGRADDERQGGSISRRSGTTSARSPCRRCSSSGEIRCTCCRRTSRSSGGGCRPCESRPCRALVMLSRVINLPRWCRSSSPSSCDGLRHDDGEVHGRAESNWRPTSPANPATRRCCCSMAAGKPGIRGVPRSVTWRSGAGSWSCSTFVGMETARGPPVEDYRLETFGADVADVARELGRPVLVGASLGGTSSLIAAAGDGHGGSELAAAGARGRRAEHRVGGCHAHRTVHAPARRRWIRLPGRGRRRHPDVQPAPAAPDEPGRAAQERPTARRRSLVLAGTRRSSSVAWAVRMRREPRWRSPIAAAPWRRQPVR